MTLTRRRIPTAASPRLPRHSRPDPADDKAGSFCWVLGGEGVRRGGYVCAVHRGGLSGHDSPAFRTFAHVAHLQIEHWRNTPAASTALGHAAQIAVRAATVSADAPPVPVTARARPTQPWATTANRDSAPHGFPWGHAKSGEPSGNVYAAASEARSGRPASFCRHGPQTLPPRQMGESTNWGSVTRTPQ